MFQHCIQTALAGLPGVRNFSDDIIVYSKTHEELTFTKSWKAYVKNSLTLNGNKCEFGKSSLEFYGYKFSNKGMEIDPKKARQNQRHPATRKSRRATKSARDDKLLCQVHSRLRHTDRTTSQTHPPDSRMDVDKRAG